MRLCRGILLNGQERRGPYYKSEFLGTFLFSCLHNIILGSYMLNDQFISYHKNTTNNETEDFFKIT